MISDGKYANPGLRYVWKYVRALYKKFLELCLSHGRKGKTRDKFRDREIKWTENRSKREGEKLKGNWEVKRDWVQGRKGEEIRRELGKKRENRKVGKLEKEDRGKEKKEDKLRRKKREFNKEMSEKGEGI